MDIKDLDRIRERVNRDRVESDHLQNFEVVKKSDIFQLCPHFEFGSKFVDDIYDSKFHNDHRHHSYRVIHGEQSFSIAKKFLVTISPKSTCEFEYSTEQIKVLQASTLDAKLPFTYKDQKEYINFQTANMHHIETKQLCGTRGKCFLFNLSEWLNRENFCMIHWWVWVPSEQIKYDDFGPSALYPL